MSDNLLPCPFCGCEAVFDEVTDEDSPDFGGHFVRCTRCLGSLGLQFANKDDPRPGLTEKWNRRASSVATPCDGKQCHPTDPHCIYPNCQAKSGEALRPLGASGKSFSRSLTSAPLPPEPEQAADDAARAGAVAKRSGARSEPPSSEGGEEKT